MSDDESPTTPTTDGPRNGFLAKIIRGTGGGGTDNDSGLADTTHTAEVLDFPQQNPARDARELQRQVVFMELVRATPKSWLAFLTWLEREHTQLADSIGYRRGIGVNEDFVFTEYSGHPLTLALVDFLPEHISVTWGNDLESPLWSLLVDVSNYLHELKHTKDADR